jgi:hypothetical protein
MPKLPVRIPPAAVPVLLTAAAATCVHLAVPAPGLLGDAWAYDFTARGLTGDADVGWALYGVTTRGVLYPGFLALLYAIGGPSPELVAWVQGLVLLPLTTLLIYVAGREAFSRRVGLVAAWCFALWLPAAWHTAWLMPETFLALLMAALAAAIAATLARQNRNLALLAGLLTAALSISHPAYQLLWVGLLVAVVALHRTRQLVVPYALGLAVVLLPFAAFMAATDAPRPGETRFYGGGWTFYVGTRWETDFTATPDDFVVAHNLANPQKLERLIDSGTIEVQPRLAEVIREKSRARSPDDRRLRNQDFYRLGVENLVNRPSRWPHKLRRNAATLFVQREDPRLDYLAPNRELWVRPLWRSSSFALAAIALGAFAYVLLRVRERVLVFVAAALQTLVLLLPHAEPRYGIPLWPALSLLAAVGLVKAYDFVQLSRSRLGRSGTADAGAFAHRIDGG